MWVIPLALYLVTFIIAFGRVPDWFRLVIGNLAPVMILLLIFVLISGVSPGHGHRAHAAHPDLLRGGAHVPLRTGARPPEPAVPDRVLPIMSVGGMLGGVFNSLVAPLVFVHAYEYKLVLIIACLMVPKLLDEKAEAELGVDRGAGGSCWCSISSSLRCSALRSTTSRSCRTSRSGISRTRFKLHERLRISQRHHRGGAPVRRAGDVLFLLRGPAAALRALRRGDPGADHDPKGERTT